MYFILFLLTSVLVVVTGAQEEILSDILDNANTPIEVIQADDLLKGDKDERPTDKIIQIQIYYESLCPDARLFYEWYFYYEVYRLLYNLLDVRIYPYGIAKTIDYKNGTVEFECQHGPEECYGNKLHACAIDILDNITAIEFTACLMDLLDPNDNGSDDATADRCAKILGFDAASIKECAKGQKGIDLLKHYGEETAKVSLDYVPFVIIDGEVWDQDKEPDFKKRVCRLFPHEPIGCKGLK